MKIRFRALFLCAAVAALPALADVSLTTGDSLRANPKPHVKAKDNRNAARRAASPAGRHALATGSISLIDSSGLKYFINTNITFSTSSSASAAMSEASYTQAVAASTLNGGTTQYKLNDAFDGYQSICINPTMDRFGPCATGNPKYVIYNKRGPATTDPTCGGRQIDFPVQTIAGLNVSRKVYVPATDSFARWLNIFTNPTAGPITVRMITDNNLGSDSNTVITGTSSGDLVATTADLWDATFQNFTGTTTTDPRLGHVLQGPGAVIPVSGIFFANGNDKPWWSYDITVPAGQTRVIMNFVTGQPSKAAAAAKAASLTTGSLPPIATACMTALEQSGTENFGLSSAVVPSLSRSGLVILGLALALGAAAILRKSIL